jgi:Leucine-rich repeat (LRR) protein
MPNTSPEVIRIETTKELDVVLERAKSEKWKEIAIRPSGSRRLPQRSSIKIITSPRKMISNIIANILKVDSLLCLDIGNNEINERDFEKIGELEWIQELNASSVEITISNMKAISRLVNLTSIDLSYCRIDLDKAKILGEMKKIKNLNIGYNDWRESEIESILDLDELMSLNVEKNDLGSKGVKLISKLKKLTSLNVSANSIDIDGARNIFQIDSLIELNISLNRIGNLAESGIDRLKKLKHLSISSNEIDAVGARTLSELNGLMSLDISDNKIGNSGVKIIESLSSLVALNLSNNKIKGDGVAFLSTLSELNHLNLNFNKIGDVGVKIISGLEKLLTLKLSLNEIRDEGLTSFFSLKALTCLDLSYNKIGDVGAKVIGELNELVSLNLSNNQIGTKGAIFLGNLSSLEELDIGYNSIGREGANSLLLLKNIEKLDISRNGISGLLGILKEIRARMKKISVLKISDNEEDFPDASRILRMISASTIFSAIDASLTKLPIEAQSVSAIGLELDKKFKQQSEQELGRETIELPETEPTSAPREKVDVAIFVSSDHAYSAMLQRFTLDKPTSMTTAKGSCTVTIVNLSNHRHELVGKTESVVSSLSPHLVLLVGTAKTFATQKNCLGDVIISRSIKKTVLKDKISLDVESFYEKSPIDLKSLEEIEINSIPMWNSIDSLTAEQPSRSSSFVVNDTQYQKEIELCLKSLDKRTYPKRVTDNLLLMESPQDALSLVDGRKQFSTIGAMIDIENADIYNVCQKANVPVLTICAISEIIGCKCSEDWTLYACHTAAAYTKMLIEAGVFVSPSEKP